jgi:hypothetical protein
MCGDSGSKECIDGGHDSSSAAQPYCACSVASGVASDSQRESRRTQVMMTAGEGELILVNLSHLFSSSASCFPPVVRMQALALSW